MDDDVAAIGIDAPVFAHASSFEEFVLDSFVAPSAFRHDFHDNRRRALNVLLVMISL